MAKFTVTDFIDVGSGGPHGATTWRVYKDKEKKLRVLQRRAGKDRWA